MRTSEVLRRAAANLGNGDGCCTQITKAGRGDVETTASAGALFRSLFGINRLFWWTSPWQSNADQEARRLALLFAAEIADDMENV